MKVKVLHCYQHESFQSLQIYRILRKKGRYPYWIVLVIPIVLVRWMVESSELNDTGTPREVVRDSVKVDKLESAEQGNVTVTTANEVSAEGKHVPVVKTVAVTVFVRYTESYP